MQNFQKVLKIFSYQIEGADFKSDNHSYQLCCCRSASACKIFKKFLLSVLIKQKVLIPNQTIILISSAAVSQHQHASYQHKDSVTNILKSSIERFWHKNNKYTIKVNIAHRTMRKNLNSFLSGREERHRAGTRRDPGNWLGQFVLKYDIWFVPTSI